MNLDMFKCEEYDISLSYKETEDLFMALTLAINDLDTPTANHVVPRLKALKERIVSHLELFED